MKCPLLATAEIWGKPRQSPKYSDCLKDECGWYLGAHSMCSIPALALRLEYLQLELDKLVTSLPRQF